MNWVQAEYAHFSHLLSKWKGEAITEVKQLEADAGPLFKQIQAELKADVYSVAKVELTTAITAAVSGGGLEAIGAAIAASVPSLIATLKLDGNAAGKNALYGLAAIVQADVLSKIDTALRAAPVPAPAPAA